MNGQHRGHDADPRSRQAGEQADVADLVHGHFQHGDVIGSVQAVQDGHGQTDLRVQVAFALENAAMRAQDAGHNLLGRGLAEAARDADHLEVRVAVQRVARHGRQRILA